MRELYAMKVARTVLRGGKFSNKSTYLNRPYAALLWFNKLLLFDKFLVYKVIYWYKNEILLFYSNLFINLNKFK
jgi:hypothetical protein